ncbi:hypothetical protein Tco_0348578 [Tanacetum coccineum]
MKLTQAPPILVIPIGLGPLNQCDALVLLLGCPRALLRLAKRMLSQDCLTVDFADPEFDVVIVIKKEQKIYVADHLSRTCIPHQVELEEKGIPENISLETLGVDFPDCEDSRAHSIHMSFTSSASFWKSSIQI